MSAGKNRDRAVWMVVILLLLSLMVATLFLGGCGDSEKSEGANGDVTVNGLPVFLNFTSPT